MADPIPKASGQRRRRNAASAPTRLPAVPTRKRQPALPGAADMTASTRAWWRTVWASPMSAVYLDADIPALVRLAVLLDRFATTGRSTDLGEIRFLEDRFGLSPLARRRLQWEVDQAAGAAAAARPVAASRDDRYLRAVEASGA